MTVVATAQKRLIDGIFRKGRGTAMPSIPHDSVHEYVAATPVAQADSSAQPECTRARRKATRTRNARIPHRSRNTAAKQSCRPSVILYASGFPHDAELAGGLARGCLVDGMPERPSHVARPGRHADSTPPQVTAPAAGGTGHLW